jgi:hypothetical protein
MDPARNPYTPGAGTPPLELAGREEIVEQARITLDRIAGNRPGRSVLLLGLRGVGKTVLLNRAYAMAEDRGFLTIRMEAPEGGELASRVLPDLRRMLFRLSTVENARDKLRIATTALRNFAAIFKLSYDGFEFGATPGPGIADTGDLERDFAELLRAVVEAARAAGQEEKLLLAKKKHFTPIGGISEKKAARCYSTPRQL